MVTSKSGVFGCKTAEGDISWFQAPSSKGQVRQSRITHGSSHVFRLLVSWIEHLPVRAFDVATSPAPYLGSWASVANACKPAVGSQAFRQGMQLKSTMAPQTSFSGSPCSLQNLRRQTDRSATELPGSECTLCIPLFIIGSLLTSPILYSSEGTAVDSGIATSSAVEASSSTTTASSGSTGSQSFSKDPGS